jgi:tetratricopeptide (TPR) repeat protein
LGHLLADSGDIEGAKAAYERSIALGSATALLSLGLMLAQQGRADEALRYLRIAQDKGDARASGAIGNLLLDKEDLAGAAAAFRRGSEEGDAKAAYGLGVVLARLDDASGTQAAFQRAHDLGHPGAAEVLKSLSSLFHERATVLTRSYIEACGNVLDAANACANVANRAVGARDMAAPRPQHEISIETFTQVAENAEKNFAPLYRTFSDECAAACDIAAQLLASHPDPVYVEAMLAFAFDEEASGKVATVKALLTATFGSDPAGFTRGVAQANELMQRAPEVGNIYRAPGPGVSKRQSNWPETG